MHRIITLAATLAVALALPAAAGIDQVWDLTEMFPTEQDFLAARADIAAAIPEIQACRGRLGESAEVLAGCLERQSEIAKAYMKLIGYASLGLDRDVRNAHAQQLRAETARVGVELSEAASFVDPEILAVGAEKIEAFIAAEPRLAPYAFGLRDTLRQAEHTLPPEQEALLSRTGLIAGKFSDVYEQLTISDLPFPEVELPGIGAVTLNQTNYVRYRGHADRAVREKVFQEFWKAYAAYTSTLGTLLDSEVQKNWFYASTRKYDSTLAGAFDSQKIPIEVYTSLVRDVRANLAILHRAIALRGRILGLEQQGYHDVYVSIVPEVDMTYDYDGSADLLAAALAPLGDDYVATMRDGLTRWVDVSPRDGKQTGAYSNGIWYDGHPWVLMNWDGGYDSLSTLAHEFGHAMHSYLSNANQPFPTSRYSGMLAEIASTFNEVLLKEQLLATTTDPQIKLFLLGEYLERVRQTVFRQAMFAEFQLEMHRRVEAGETLTGEALSALYLQLLRDYHGHEQGVMTIDDLYGAEWSYIPHFYMGYYVYQYATGLVAATALAENALAGSEGAVERYRGMLSAGGSDYPIEILERAGCDLTSPEPFAITMRAMERTMDQIEELLAARDAAKS